MGKTGFSSNCLLLVLLLRQSPLVGEVLMVNGGNNESADPQMMLDEWQVPLVSMDEAMTRCDVLIEMSAQFTRTGSRPSASAAARW